VREVLVDDEGRQATVIVPDDQLSLAIGREGQNARLAARLTGWRIDIKSETEFATHDEGDYGEGEEQQDDGRCHAILTSGRRCPNASLPGSRYCGVDSHQALAQIDSDRLADLQGGDGAAAEAPEVSDAQAAAEADANGGSTEAEAADGDDAGEAAESNGDGAELAPQPEGSEPTGEAS